MPSKPVAAKIRTGQTLRCKETGQTFVANPSIPNFILHPKHGVLSFEGLLARSLRDLADYTGPLTAYLALNGKTVTNRLGAKLGDVHHEATDARGQTSIRARDLFGKWWRGRGSGRGRIINLRPMADPTVPTYRETTRKLIIDLERAAINFGINGHHHRNDCLTLQSKLDAARGALLDHLHLGDPT